MINISASSNLQEIERQLRFMQNQIPFAASLAINKTAQVVKKDLSAATYTSFKAPTNYTVGGFFLKPATKTDLSSMVWVKDDGSSGVPAINFVGPNIFGGNRHLKSHEKKLRSMGILGGQYFALPAQGAFGLLDQYGNLRKGLIKEMMASFGVLRPSRRSGDLEPVGRQRPYFVEYVNHVAQGIFRASGSGVQPILWFTHKQPVYKVRFDFGKIAKQSVDDNLQAQTLLAIQQAIQSARGV